MNFQRSSPSNNPFSTISKLYANLFGLYINKDRQGVLYKIGELDPVFNFSISLSEEAAMRERSLSILSDALKDNNQVYLILCILRVLSKQYQISKSFQTEEKFQMRFIEVTLPLLESHHDILFDALLALYIHLSKDQRFHSTFVKSILSRNIFTRVMELDWDSSIELC